MLESIVIYSVVIVLTLFLIKATPSLNLYKSKFIDWGIKTLLSIIVVSYPLIVLLGARVDIGTDYANYERFYDYYQKTGKTTFEPIFLGLLWICDINNWSFDAFIIITSILCVIIPLGFIKIKFSKKDLFVATFTLLVLLFGSWFNIVRQTLAMGVLLISIHYLIERKVFLYVLFVLLASLCHISSLVFLPLVLIKGIVNGAKTQERLIRNLFLLGFACIILIFLYLKYGTNIAYYDSVGGNEENGITSKWFIIFSIFLYIPELSNIKEVFRNYKRYSILYAFMILELCCYIFGLYMNLGYRIGQIFSLVHVFLLPLTINCSKKENKRIVKFYIVSILSIFFYFTTFIAKYNGMCNYKYSTSTLRDLIPFFF